MILTTRIQDQGAKRTLIVLRGCGSEKTRGATAEAKAPSSSLFTGLAANVRVTEVYRVGLANATWRLTMSQSSYELIVKRFFEDVLNQGDQALVDDLFAPDVVYYDPGNPFLPRGRAASSSRYTALPSPTCTSRWTSCLPIRTRSSHGGCYVARTARHFWAIPGQASE